MEFVPGCKGNIGQYTNLADMSIYLVIRSICFNTSDVLKQIGQQDLKSFGL